MLAATVAISVIVSEDAFARERYSGDSTSQAAAVSNDCLNPILDSNTIDNAVGVGNCGGTVSQQDESGQASAPITSQTANPSNRVAKVNNNYIHHRGLGASMTCEECFDILSATQETAIETMLWATFNTQQRGSAGSDIVELIGDIHVCEKNSSRHTPLFGRVSWLILKERSRIMGS